VSVYIYENSLEDKKKRIKEEENEKLTPKPILQHRWCGCCEQHPPKLSDTNINVENYSFNDDIGD
jgi:hypothetical protein